MFGQTNPLVAASRTAIVLIEAGATVEEAVRIAAHEFHVPFASIERDLDLAVAA